MAHLRTVPTAILAAVLLLGVACGGDDVETTTATTEVDGTTTTTAPSVGTVDWASGKSTVTLPNGWVLGPCESGPRQLCARSDGDTVASIELTDYPASSYPHVQAVLDAGGSDRNALEAHGAQFVDSFVTDRKKGCGAEYEVKALPVESAELGGRPAITYGFDGVVGGRTVERNRHWMTLEKGSLFLVSANGIEPASCMDNEELVTMTVAQLRALEATLARVFAESPLPAPSLCVVRGTSILGPCQGTGR